MGPITIGTGAYAAGGFSGRQDHLTLVDAPTVDTATLQHAVNSFPGARVFTKHAYIDKQNSGINQLLTIFDVQDTIAARVAQAISVRWVDGGSTRGTPYTQDSEAYALYASGQFAWARQRCRR